MPPARPSVPAACVGAAPVIASVAPLPTTIAAAVLVPLVIELNAGAPPLAARGPTVAPAMRTNNPDAVVHRSPLTGAVGAAPCGRFSPAVPVADATVVNSPVIVHAASAQSADAWPVNAPVIVATVKLGTVPVNVGVAMDGLVASTIVPLEPVTVLPRTVTVPLVEGSVMVGDEALDVGTSVVTPPPNVANVIVPVAVPEIPMLMIDVPSKLKPGEPLSAPLPLNSTLWLEPAIVSAVAPLMNNPVALSVPAPCAPPVGDPIVTPAPASVMVDAVAAPLPSANFMSAFVVIVPKPGKPYASHEVPLDV